MAFCLSRLVNSSILKITAFRLVVSVKSARSLRGAARHNFPKMRNINQNNAIYKCISVEISSVHHEGSVS